jgi:hypothetical protein
VAAKAAGMRQATAKATRSRAVEALLGGLAAGALLLDDADEEGCRWARGTAEGISMAPVPSPPLPMSPRRRCLHSCVLHLTV